MRLLAPLLALAFASSAAALPALPALPHPTHLVVAGAGFGSASMAQGTVRCEDFPFAAAVTYFPDGEATVALSWLGVESGCPALGGGVLALGQLVVDTEGGVPTLRWERICEGSATLGATCGGLLEVGPFAGPGSQVWVRGAGFEGSFLAL